MQTKTVPKNKTKQKLRKTSLSWRKKNHREAKTKLPTPTYRTDHDLDRTSGPILSIRYVVQELYHTDPTRRILFARLRWHLRAVSWGSPPDELYVTIKISVCLTGHESTTNTPAKKQPQNRIRKGTSKSRLLRLHRCLRKQHAYIVHWRCSTTTSILVPHSETDF